MPRRKILYVHPQRLLTSLVTGARLTNLPPDAQAQGVFIEPHSQMIGIYVDSETFQPVPEGNVMEPFYAEVEDPT